MNRKLEITIDSKTRNVESFIIEGRKIDPRSVFVFDHGKWKATLHNFPVSDDNILNIFILVEGNTGENSKMIVEVDGLDKGPYSLFEPFNRVRLGQFNQKIQL